MTTWCCPTMQRNVEYRCEDHPDPYECADNVVVYEARFREYGLVIHDGGTSYLSIEFCPWCGTRLPESERDRWFEELERRGVEDSDDAPPDMQDESWLLGQPTGFGQPNPSGATAEVLSDHVNFVVVRTEGRRFPGIVVQGDRLPAWAHYAAKSDRDSIEMLFEDLKETVAEYDRVGEAHGLLYEPRFDLPDRPFSAADSPLVVRETSAVIGTTIHRVDDVYLYLDPGGGITIKAVTTHGDPVELSGGQARAIAAVLENLAAEDQAD